MPPRTPLSRDRALAEAVALADAEGIDAVSMRRLAARLDVVPMALYKHVTNKSDLLDGMVETLIASYDPPDPALGWKAAVRAQILSARRVLLDHPWARQVIETRTTRTPQVLGYMDRLSGTFIEGGFTPDLTHHVMHALGHRIWGFSPEAFDDPDSLQPPADPAARQAMAEAVVAAAKEHPALGLSASEIEAAERRQSIEAHERDPGRGRTPVHAHDREL